MATAPKRKRTSVFISYRREGGAETARLIYEKLKQRGVEVFLDVIDLGGGVFDERILRAIEHAANFVIILYPGCLDRCESENDWLRLEIAHALKNKLNIVPVFKDGFSKIPDGLPPDMADLRRFNAVEYSYQLLDPMIELLNSFLLATGKKSGGRIRRFLPRTRFQMAAAILLVVAVVGAFWLALPMLRPGIRPIATSSPLTGMVSIPGGTFVMGCVEGGTPCAVDEKPAHMVTLSSFYMDVHEVTVADYVQCVNAGTCKKPRGAEEFFEEFFNWNKPARENHPVNGVDWNEANTYCKWRQKRLPTEAEFEYALRGGRQGKIYPWGNSATPPARFGNYADTTYSQSFPYDHVFRSYTDGYVDTASACSFARNAYGLCDISGNVWEWTADWYDKNYYQSSLTNNPQGPSSGSYRVLRGGGWNSDPWYARASYRDFEKEPDFWSYNIGFRCARD